LLKTFINWIIYNGETQKGVVQWGLLGASGAAAATSVIQYIKHNEFEKECDALWIKYEHLIEAKYNFLEINSQIPYNFEEALEKFNKIMYNLRNTCENTSPDWILADGNNFINYMLKIAVVMDYAYKIIVYL